MKTNRDLYKAITALMNAQRNKPALSLEQYLSSLRSRAKLWENEEGLALETFYSLLADTFSPAPAIVDEQGPITEGTKGFGGWDAMIRRQIKDLRQMKERGQLDDKMNYFGIKAPSGQQWYNFDPCSFLECAAAGCFGGWEEGDQTGRLYVDGQVAVTTENGETITCDPRDLKDPIKEIGNVSWDLFTDFLWFGQHYE
jgi:hypothetical protein